MDFLSVWLIFIWVIRFSIFHIAQVSVKYICSIFSVTFCKVFSSISYNN